LKAQVILSLFKKHYNPLFSARCGVSTTWKHIHVRPKAKPHVS